MAAPGAAGAAGRGLQALHSQQKEKQVPVATGTLWLSITLGACPAEDKPQGAAGSGRLQFLTWQKLHGWCHTEGATEARPHPPSATGTNSCSRSGTKRSLPFHLSLPAPKADSFPPEGHFYLFPGKGDQQLQKCPQQLQLLSQACLGMEMCSWHKKSRPEPAFGYQPWVWFEILPEEKVHPLVLPQTLEKSPATKSNPCLPSSSSAHLSGEAQAAAPWHLSKPHWPPIHRSQCQNL